MDSGAWQATVHGVAESDTAESHTHTHTHYVSESDLLKIQLESSSVTIPYFPPAYNIL